MSFWPLPLSLLIVLLGCHDRELYDIRSSPIVSQLWSIVDQVINKFCTGLGDVLGEESVCDALLIGFDTDHANFSDNPVEPNRWLDDHCQGFFDGDEPGA